MVAFIKTRGITMAVGSAVLVALCAMPGCAKRDRPAPPTSEAPSTASAGQVADPTPMASAPRTTDAAEALRILYAGHPGSARERDFVGFLAKHFGTVKTGDLKTFKAGDAQGFDVTILDYDGDGFKAPRPALPQGFSRPVITVGVVGGFICGSLNLKTGYL